MDFGRGRENEIKAHLVHARRMGKSTGTDPVDPYPVQLCAPLYTYPFLLLLRLSAL
jgi:hypothetical protein